ncbi:RDD family protein [Niastella caeni]|uniref:RDD family protein n=1 Tax=Niastella caeni TaxID=2569763 RepID=A0A4S8I4Q7_9BACT|nr:RDD family protein [Niastella caeni]THU41732.1 RDD family protein [Niastella caeni]
MKKLKPVTICLVIALILFQHISRGSYYKGLITGEISGNYGKLYTILQVGLDFIIDIFTIILGIAALSYSDLQVRDRAYSIFRFVYVMTGFLALPTVVFSLVISGGMFFNDPATGFVIISRHLIWITLIVLLLICKPENPIKKVNLQEYDMVAYTSIGHRFVHYLLDYFLILPFWMSAASFLYVFNYMVFGSASYSSANPTLFYLYYFVSYLLYYFLAEAIFRQTLGKMVTRSCVVSDGVQLSTGRILLRTLSRLIPFDPIAFLFGAKWHDRVSSTAVVYIDSWEKVFEEEKGVKD